CSPSPASPCSCCGSHARASPPAPAPASAAERRQAYERIGHGADADRARARARAEHARDRRRQRAPRGPRERTRRRTFQGDAGGRCLSRPQPPRAPPHGLRRGRPVAGRGRARTQQRRAQPRGSIRSRMSRYQQVVSSSQSGVSMNHSRLLLLAAALAALGACQPKTAATAGEVSPPVATVDGTPISRDFYEFYIKGISGKTSAELAPEQRSLALDNLIRARLILVATEPFAEKIVTRLGKGEKFDELARRESMDPSKSNGGDLGWFTPDRMVPEFSGAVMALKPGEYTHKPVQTQFGWHVIQLLDTRELTPPPFEQVRQRLEQIVQNKKFHGYADELMRSAKIQRFLDKAPSGQAAAPSGQAAAPSGQAAPAGTPAAPAPSPTPRKN